MTSYSDDRGAIRPYLSDESSAFQGTADRVYFPSSAGEVAEVLEEATRSGTGVTVSGGGTSITGARVPRGGWILATDRLVSVDPIEGRRRISTEEGDIFLDPDRLLARVPAGLRLSSLDSAIEPLGLFYPPTLTERSAMMGGTIATNASGARSYHFGSTRDWINGLTVVLATGEILKLKRTDRIADGLRLKLSSATTVDLPDIPGPDKVKNVAGYFVRPEMDAVDLFIGGEGTLGVVTEAEVRLEHRAAGALTVLVFTGERDRALDIADRTREGLFEPWTVFAIEFFNRDSLDFMREAFNDIPPSDAAVLIEFASADERQSSWFGGGALITEWLNRLSAFEPDDVWVVLPTEEERVRDFRHALPDRVNDFVRTRRGKLGTDIAVPAGSFRQLMTAYDRAASGGVKSVLFGHLGEYHLHLNFLAEDEPEMVAARSLYLDLARTAVALGGTVSAEHGIGKKRVWLDESTTIPYLELMVGEAGMKAMARLKEQLDPAWILNRDTVLPWSVR